jgi:hypothetical protein
MTRHEILKQSPDEGHRNSYIHEVRHDFCFANLSILGIVTPPLNRHGPDGLSQPTGECQFAKVGSLCGEMEEATSLGRRGR